MADIDDVLKRLTDDDDFRKAVAADPAAALSEYELSPEHLAAIDAITVKIESGEEPGLDPANEARAVTNAWPSKVQRPIQLAEEADLDGASKEGASKTDEGLLSSAGFKVEMAGEEAESLKAREEGDELSREDLKADLPGEVAGFGKVEWQWKRAALEEEAIDGTSKDPSYLKLEGEEPSYSDVVKMEGLEEEDPGFKVEAFADEGGAGAEATETPDLEGKIEDEPEMQDLSHEEAEPMEEPPPAE